jgi:hypothetical protein
MKPCFKFCSGGPGGVPAQPVERLLRRQVLDLGHGNCVTPFAHAQLQEPILRISISAETICINFDSQVLDKIASKCIRYYKFLIYIYIFR